MEYSNCHNNAQRIAVLKKIILSYLEQYMVHHVEQEVNSYTGFKKLIQEQNLKNMFRVLGKGLLLNIEQFLKSRKWMNEENARCLKNITITSINIIPEDQEKSSIDSEAGAYDLKQVSSDSLETIIIPDGRSKLGEDDRTSLNEEYVQPRKSNTDVINGDIKYTPGLILGKLNFISLSLMSINKMLEKPATPACSETA